MLNIHSAAGRTLSDGLPFLSRPYRSPHHTISDVGLLGGGAIPGPGEISLAHHGVLFLDELPEFKRSALEVMRQPLEDGHVTISRSAGKVTLPCSFMLVAAMNPCACGYLGDPRHECRCTPAQIQRYRARISGPLLDRIDLHVEAPSLTVEELRQVRPGEPSAAIRARVEAARLRQRARFAGTRTTANARMTHAQIRAALRHRRRARPASCSRPWNSCTSPPAPTTASSRSPAPSPTWPAPTPSPRRTFSKPSSTAASTATCFIDPSRARRPA